jgi:hypothetical protein
VGVLPVDFAVAAEAEGVVTNQRLREQIAALDAGDGGPWEAGYAAAIKDVLALLPADEPSGDPLDEETFEVECPDCKAHFIVGQSDAITDCSCMTDEEIENCTKRCKGDTL